MSEMSPGLSDALRDLAAETTAPSADTPGSPSAVTKRQAVVTAVDWTTKTVTIKYPEASTEIPSVQCVGTYSPAVNDTVWVEEMGTDRLVTGTQASSPNGADPPTGSIVLWPTATPPPGWLICNGGAIPSQYADLIALVGANTPNLAGRVPLGASGGHALGSTGGAETVTLSTSQMPSHDHNGDPHTHTGPSHTHNGPAHGHPPANNQNFVCDGGGGPGANIAQTTPGGYVLHNSTGTAGTGATSSGGTGATGSGGGGNTSNTGGGNSHENMPPFLALNFIIKA